MYLEGYIPRSQIFLPNSVTGIGLSSSKSDGVVYCALNRTVKGFAAHQLSVLFYRGLCNPSLERFLQKFMPG